MWNVKMLAQHFNVHGVEMRGKLPYGKPKKIISTMLSTGPDFVKMTLSYAQGYHR